MAHPQLAIPHAKLISAYETAGSCRGAARILGVSRWTVGHHLRLHGIQPRDKRDASDQANLLRAPTVTRTAEHVEWWGPPGMVGSTCVIRLTPRPPACIWPDCDDDQTDGLTCGPHHAVLVAASTGRCAWPHCGADTITTSLCVYHDGRASGRIT